MKTMFKREQYLNELIRKRDNGRIKIVTGMRQTGKSFLLFELYKNHLLSQMVGREHIIELRLADMSNIRYRNPFRLDEYLRKRLLPERQNYIFIDDIQLCAQLPNPYLEGEMVGFVDVLLGLRKCLNADIYVTCGNSKMLSRENPTQFRDRWDHIHVFPLSFAECLELGGEPERVWQSYLHFGGLPWVWRLETPEEKGRYLKNLFNETCLKDILERENIQNKREILDLLLDFTASAVGSFTNSLKLSRHFQSEREIGINSSTIATYLGYLEEAFLLSTARRHDIKGSRRFKTPVKYYFTDIGLRNSRLNFRKMEENHLIENILHTDLLRRGLNVDIGVVESFGKVDGKTQRKRFEIDFVATRGNERAYVQSALQIGNPNELEQKRQSLRRIKDGFRRLIIVREPVVPRYDKFGIFHVGLRDFLCDESLLFGS